MYQGNGVSQKKIWLYRGNTGQTACENAVRHLGQVRGDMIGTLK